MSEKLETGTKPSEKALRNRYKFDHKFGHPRLHGGALKGVYAPLMKTDLKLSVPAYFSLRSIFEKSIPVRDQGYIGDCVAFATGYYWDYLKLLITAQEWNPSHLYIYFYGRKIGGYDEKSDSGMTVLDGLTAVIQQGVCPETMWPYIPANMSVQPPVACDQMAEKNRASSCLRVEQKLRALKNALFGEKKPVIFGIMCYSSFESQEVANTGTVPYPDVSTEDFLGGHCILIVGYDDAKQVVTFINSWSSQWGDKGFGTLPYAYLLNTELSSEFYVLSS